MPESVTAHRRGTENDAKGSINLRIEEPIKRLIDEAAALQGRTRTEFMVESARIAAVDVLLDQRLFVLDDLGHAAFVKALDAAPAPDRKLRGLLQRVPIWQR